MEVTIKKYNQWAKKKVMKREEWPNAVQKEDRVKEKLHQSTLSRICHIHRSTLSSTSVTFTQDMCEFVTFTHILDAKASWLERDFEEEVRKVVRVMNGDKVSSRQFLYGVLPSLLRCFKSGYYEGFL